MVTINGGSTITAIAGTGASAVGLGKSGQPAADDATFLHLDHGTLRLPAGSALERPRPPRRPTPGSASAPRDPSPAPPAPPRPTAPSPAPARSATTARSPCRPPTSPPPTITGHHYHRHLRHRRQLHHPDPVTVYADTLTHGARTLPTDPTKNGSIFTGWNTQANGTGTTLTATTTLPGTSTDGTAHPVNLHAQYDLLPITSIEHLQTALSTCAVTTHHLDSTDLADPAATLDGRPAT